MIFCVTLILSIFVFSLPVVIRKDVSFSVDNIGNITTDLFVRPTDTHQYLLATSYHRNHY